jgi:2-polyprenyl-3-methyl-5-hydroxy-6-metoxy-1,4-benzoquinol methylase
MKKPDTSIIDQPWPEHELEYVNACPYCGSKERTLAYKDVQDWSFYCAPGKWTYWDCKGCEAFYLSPRPTEASIGLAYSSYYTHGSSESSLKQRIKSQLKNECFSHWLHANFYPRLHIPSVFGFLLLPFKKIIGVPFELPFLVQATKGSVLDVGCGSGGKLKLAKSLGWEVTGLELDLNAVEVARAEGVNVIHGNYKKLAYIDNSFDCIICSHVLEHVHDPVSLLELLVKRLKKNGTLLLSLPNAHSHLRILYSENWRGIEAPRHLAIPTIKQMLNIMHKLGRFEIKQGTCHYNTLAESKRIRRRQLKSNLIDLTLLKLSILYENKAAIEGSDYIQLTVLKIE